MYKRQKEAEAKAKNEALANIEEQQKLGAIKIAEQQKERATKVAETNRDKNTQLADTQRDEEIKVAIADKERESKVAEENAEKESRIAKASASMEVNKNRQEQTMWSISPSMAHKENLPCGAYRVKANGKAISSHWRITRKESIILIK